MTLSLGLITCSIVGGGCFCAKCSSSSLSLVSGILKLRESVVPWLTTPLCTVWNDVPLGAHYMNQNLHPSIFFKNLPEWTKCFLGGRNFTFLHIKKGSTKIIPKIRVFLKCHFHWRALPSYIRARSCHHEDLGQPLVAQGLPWQLVQITINGLS
jgi:hypothetical protein